MAINGDTLPGILRHRIARDERSDTVEFTDVPARLDRLPWSRFHWLVVVALGVTWILDGLEVTLVASLAGGLTHDQAMKISDTEIGAAASLYLAGAVLGALLFGYLTDKLGRKPLFSITVLLYAAATVATGCSWSFWSFALFRFLTGAGIGGEYVAINSAIQELIPARYRGWTDLAINGSFWVGAGLGAVGSIIALDPSIVGPAVGWRLPFAIGGALGLIVLFLRRHVPESPRWLMTHGRVAEADRETSEIERRVRIQRGTIPTLPKGAGLRLRQHYESSLIEVARAVAINYPKRTILCVVLMASQAFFYNAIFFTYALVLTRFYGVSPGGVGGYILAFALGNFLGPLLLGRLFDRIGRKPMITGTYAIAGLMMVAVAILFADGALTAVGQTAAWTGIFFFASAAASSAYLTVSESFPIEIRALVIAIFYAGGTALGGIAGPIIFGALIDTGSRHQIMWGYLASAALMLGAALTETLMGVKAERLPLESVARPISAVD